MWSPGAPAGSRKGVSFAQARLRTWPRAQVLVLKLFPHPLRDAFSPHPPPLLTGEDAKLGGARACLRPSCPLQVQPGRELGSVSCQSLLFQGSLRGHPMLCGEGKEVRSCPWKGLGVGARRTASCSLLETKCLKHDLVPLCP